MQRGASDAEVVLAWHGLARTCRDMDELARPMSHRYRVICPDVIGRGSSRRSPLPATEYCVSLDAQMACALADPLGLAQRHWVGASAARSLGGASSSWS
jgi:pimeloyl-ACP methyl ester carboxylesterase